MIYDVTYIVYEEVEADSPEEAYNASLDADYIYQETDNYVVKEVTDCGKLDI